jgi:hypothetical protein
MESEWAGVVIALGVVAFVALILAIIFVPMVRRWRVKQQVMQTGVEARATIVRTWDTGARINDDPVVGMMLQVQPSGGPSFQAEVNETVSIVQIALFQPGAQLQVKYDPADQRRVAIVSVITGSAAGAPGGSSMMNTQQAEQLLTRYQAENERLLTSGVSAPAKILQYMPMGVNVNGNNPAVNLIVEVQPAGVASFTAQAHGNVIAEASVYKFQPGQMVTVRYNPEDLTEVALERSGL